jgi:integrase
MASLIKRPGSPYWFAAFDVPQSDGSVRRLKKSTKKRKRSEAMAEALRIEEVERRGSLSTSETGSKSYLILSEAAEAAARGELSEARARELIAKIAEISTGNPLRFYTVKSWADDYLATKASRGKPATVARYTSHVGAFLGWLGEKADKKLETVTKSDAREFRDNIRLGWPKIEKNGKEPVRTAKTTNHYAADVAAMFRSAVREGMLLASPFAALEKLPENDSIERDVFTVAEVGRLVESAGKPEWQDDLFPRSQGNLDIQLQRARDWQGIILLGFYTGARLGDCAAMKWEHVDLDRRTITFVPAKTERKRKKLEIPIHARLFSFLESFDGERVGSLFPSQARNSARGNQGLSAQFVEILKLAGIDRKELRAGTSRRRAQYARGFHSLRHSLTSNLANLDVSEEIRRRIVGHDSPDVHAKYTHTERETLARALSKLPNV